MNRDFEFQSNTSGALLRGRLVAPEETTPPDRLVVMLTGDGPKGTKSLSWANMPPKLLEHGIASFLFDFEGLGFSDGDRSKLTVSKGIDNLRSAMSFLARQPWAQSIRLGAFASSFGATVLLLTPDLANSFTAIGMKSPAAFLPDAYLSEVSFSLFDRWATEGYLQENGYAFGVLLDALQYNAYATAKEIRTPCLITHGDKDQVVPVIQSKYLAYCLAGPKRLEIFQGVGHGYSEGDAWDRMAQMFVDWFVDRL